MPGAARSRSLPDLNCYDQFLGPGKPQIIYDEIMPMQCADPSAEGPVAVFFA